MTAYCFHLSESISHKSSTRGAPGTSAARVAYCAMQAENANTPASGRRAASSRLENVSADGSPRFDTRIRVRRGDRLGIYTEGGVPTGYDVGPGDVSKGVHCNPSVGEAVGTGTSCMVDTRDARANVSARLRRR